MEETNGGDQPKRKRRKNFRDFNVVGVTTDGKNVWGGVFPLVNSEGIMLEFIVHDLHKRNSVVDWYGFWKDSMEHGWNPGSTRTKIISAIGEVFGPKVREGHRPKLDFLHDVEMAKRSEDEKELNRLLIERRIIDRQTQRERLINTLNKRK